MTDVTPFNDPHAVAITDRGDGTIVAYYADADVGGHYAQTWRWDADPDEDRYGWTLVDHDIDVDLPVIP